ncbi:MAG: hypothetical protein OES79_08685 [Planctomycetota bacterium]|nr:hypothetical protein [Planctomycetota bacterium]
MATATEFPGLGGDGNGGHEERVTRILRRAGRETGLRDVVTFSLARAWSILLIVGSVMYVLFAGHEEPSDGGTPSRSE